MIIVFFGFGMLYLGVICLNSGGVLIIDWEILNFFGLDFGVIYIFDSLRLVFGGVVCLISGCVFFYSCRYISEDENIVRFSLIVFLFVMVMLVFVFSSRMLGILMG